MIEKILPTIIIAAILGIFGFYIDFQGLKASVKHDKVLLLEMRDDIKIIKKELMEKRWKNQELNNTKLFLV